MCAGRCVGVITMIKAPDQNDLKFGMVVILDTVSKPIDFAFKWSGFRVRLGSGLGLRLQIFETSGRKLFMVLYRSYAALEEWSHLVILTVMHVIVPVQLYCFFVNLSLGLGIVLAMGMGLG